MRLGLQELGRVLIERYSNGDWSAPNVRNCRGSQVSLGSGLAYSMSLMGNALIKDSAEEARDS